MPDLLATDGLTYVLGFAAAAAFLLHTYLTPQSLVHPILLGRQSDVERVRKPGESAVYRNYGTGQVGRLPVRPAQGIQTLLDLVKPDFTGKRSLWLTSVTNEELKSRISALASGIVRLAGLQPKESNVLLLLNDGIDFLLADLALASQSITSFTLSSLTLLSAVLESHPPSAIILHVHFLGTVLELIAENREYEHHTLILVGEGDLPEVIKKVPVKILWLSDLERKGSSEKVEALPIGPDDVFSVSFYPGPNNELKSTQLTHQNITAGVTAVRFLVPQNDANSPADSIVSSHSLSTPYGRAIAYTALYEGASFTTSDSTILFTKEDEATATRKGDDEVVKRITSISPPPTVLFLTSSQLHYIVASILANAKKSTVFPVAWRHKIFHIQQGFLSKDGVWDRQVFDTARKSVLNRVNDSLRAIVVSKGIIEASGLTPIRVALSAPFVHVHEHPLVAGPVFASHPLDLQSFSDEASKANPTFLSIAHVGPPATNVEVKLAGVNDDAVESGADPVGEVVFRGPSVTLPLDDESTPHNWVRSGERALVQSNGAFKVIPTL